MSVVVIGGTSGLGLEVARYFAGEGAEVIIAGRDAARAEERAASIGARGVAVDLTGPGEIASALAGIARVDHLVLTAIERDQNTVASYDVGRALRLVTLKLVGYAEVVHALHPAMHPASSIVMFGGLAMARPYPGSTTVSTINGGVVGLVNTLACELAPIRVNGVHPGFVSDSPFWSDKRAVLDAMLARTPAGRLATMADVRDAAVFLLRNPAVNGVHLAVDGGWLLK